MTGRSHAGQAKVPPETSQVRDSSRFYLGSRDQLRAFLAIRLEFAGIEVESHYSIVGSGPQVQART